MHLPVPAAPVVKRLGFVELGVRDLEATTGFFTEVGQLGITERGRGRSYLTGGMDHHWLRLREDHHESFRLGYEVNDDAALEEIARRLDDAGMPFTEHSNLSEDRLDRSIVVRDVDGVELELFVQMVELPVPPTQPIVRMVDTLHAVWKTSDAVNSYRFYAETLGFRPSDWIERFCVFMRSGNRYHHSAAIAGAAADGPSLDHFCILVEDIDDVMRARSNAMRLGANLRQDICRHAASGSMGVYVEDPSTGISIEFCTDHRKIEASEEAEYRARIMPASPVTVDVWQAAPPEIGLESGAPRPGAWTSATPKPPEPADIVGVASLS
jgi:2,3-dihydroxy-p-cumate/2,3-dihydroxybenzoate 3,4-dioxygenase